MIAAIYTRVSTEDQEREGTSLQSQLRACRKLAAERGYKSVDNTVFQEVWPGSDMDRPELNKFRSLIRGEEVDAAICYSTDRLARNPIHIAIIAEECDRRGISLIFVTEPLDSSPEGQLIMYVKGYAAQIEREKIRERTVRGKRERARSGKLPQATGRGIFGYRYNPDTGRREIVEAEAETVRYIFDMVNRDYSIHAIAQILNREQIPNFSGNKWHPLTVRRMVINPVFTGITHYGKTKRISLGGKKRRLEERPSSEWIEVPNATPSIITKEQFQSAQEALSKRRRVSHTTNNYLLTGHIFCGYCGGPMCGSTLRGRYRYYYCRRTTPDYAIPTKCQARYVRAGEAEEAVWDEVSNVIMRPDLILAEIKRQKGDMTNPCDSDLKRIEREIRACRDWEKRMVRLYGFGEIDEDYIRQETQRSKMKRESLEQEQDRLQKQKESLASLDVSEEKIKNFCKNLEHRLNNLNKEEKRLALEALDIKVLAWPDRLELQGAIPSYVTIAQTSA